MHGPSIIPVLLAVFALACTSAESPNTASKDATPSAAQGGPDSKQPDSKTPDAKQPDGKPSTDPATPTTEPSAVPDQPSGGLHLVALREGPLSLAVWKDRPYLLANGEPIPVDAAGRPQPKPDMLAGLRPRSGMFTYDNGTLAFAGDIDGEAWVTTVLDYDRTAAEYDVYVRKQARWQRLPIEQGPIVEFHPAYVAREGALLGLRAYASNPEEDIFESEDDGPEVTAFRRKLDKAFNDAAQGFVHLAGPSPSALPLPPPKTILFAAVATSDGILYALARPARTSKEREQDLDDDDKATLLVWPKGLADATVLELPNYPSTDNLSLSVAGEHALIGGSMDGQPYLALAHAGAIEQVVVNGIDCKDMITSAARLPSGELWVVLGDYNCTNGGAGPSDSLWMRPLPGTSAESAPPSWQRVALPTPSGELVSTGKRWVWDSLDVGWDERTRKPVQPEPAALLVAAAQGAVWIVADVGDLWVEEVMTTALRRTAVYTTAPVEGPGVAIEPLDHSFARQYAALEPDRKPGSRDCQYITLVLGEPTQAADFETKITALEREAVDVFVQDLYIGELDGKRELVLGMRSYAAKKATAEIEELAKAIGIDKPVIDCRPRMLVEMVEKL